MWNYLFEEWSTQSGFSEVIARLDNFIDECFATFVPELKNEYHANGKSFNKKCFCNNGRAYALLVSLCVR